MSLSNGWTGGQYSIFRVIFGTYLAIHFAQLMPWAAELFSDQGVLPQATPSPFIHLFPNVLALFDGPVLVTALLGIAVGLSILFAIGWHDRWLALLLWYIWACLFGRNPLISNPSLPFVGWMLVAHAFLPQAPYGSWSARGRPDPGGNWQMPPAIFAVAWIVMALGYTYSGYTKLVSPSWIDGTAIGRVLNNPLARPSLIRDFMLSLPDWMLHLSTWAGLGLELAFAPLVLVGRLRPWLWSLMIMMHFSLLVLIDFADLSLGMVMLHLFTFDPGWIKPRQPLPLPPSPPAAGGEMELLFYDGHCGLCHRMVRFLLAEDRTGTAFRFCPLDSATFRKAVAESGRLGLPDSLVLQTAEGTLLTRSAAIIHILKRLGGVWRLVGGLGACIPRKLGDRIYDGIAAIRYRLFRTPDSTCPLVPQSLRARFEL